MPLQPTPLKLGITTEQADAITANTAKLGVTGTPPGEMQYWDGTAWVVVPPGTEGQGLSFCGGVLPGGGCSISDVTNPTTGKTWMDKNLGASQAATSSTDAAAYGDLYQWGRGTDGHQIRTSGTTAALSDTDTPGHGDFITVGSAPYDWRSPQNDNLWQGVNGVNNPCPAGYRIPTETELDAERLIWSSNNAAGAFGSPLKLPLAGYRSPDGSVGGSTCFYWSYTVSGTTSRLLYFSSNADAGMFSGYRAYGYSVRCIKD